MMLMTMEFPLDRDIMTTVRLVTGGICALVGLDIDSAEDCKVCVTEGLLLLLHGGCKTARLTFERGEQLGVTMLGTGGERAAEKSVEEEISAALLSALVEDLEMHEEEGGTRISFGFGTL